MGIDTLRVIMQANLEWMQGIVTNILMQPPFIWYVSSALLFVVLGFIKYMIKRS